MSTLVGLQESREAWEPPQSTPLDDAVWQAWVERGRARARRGAAARLKTTTWISIMTLLAVAGLWSHLAPYDVVARFIVAAGAIAVTFQAFRTGHQVWGAVFGALALLYNPVVPGFAFSGDWQRAVVVATAIPFVFSLGWGARKVGKP